MIADFSRRVSHIKFGDFRNGWAAGLGQMRSLVRYRFAAASSLQLAAPDPPEKGKYGRTADVGLPEIFAPYPALILMA